MSILYILEEYHVDTEMLSPSPKHALRECGEKVFSMYSRDRLFKMLCQSYYISWNVSKHGTRESLALIPSQSQVRILTTQGREKAELYEMANKTNR